MFHFAKKTAKSYEICNLIWNYGIVFVSLQHKT